MDSAGDQLNSFIRQTILPFLYEDLGTAVRAADYYGSLKKQLPYAELYLTLRQTLGGPFFKAYLHPNFTDKAFLAAFANFLENLTQKQTGELQHQAHLTSLVKQWQAIKTRRLALQKQLDEQLKIARTIRKAHLSRLRRLYGLLEKTENGRRIRLSLAESFQQLRILDDVLESARSLNLTGEELGILKRFSESKEAYDAVDFGIKIAEHQNSLQIAGETIFLSSLPSGVFEDEKTVREIEQSLEELRPFETASPQTAVELLLRVNHIDGLNEKIVKEIAGVSAAAVGGIDISLIDPAPSVPSVYYSTRQKALDKTTKKIEKSFHEEYDGQAIEFAQEITDDWRRRLRSGELPAQTPPPTQVAILAAKIGENNGQQAQAMAQTFLETAATSDHPLTAQEHAEVLAGILAENTPLSAQKLNKTITEINEKFEKALKTAARTLPDEPIKIRALEQPAGETPEGARLTLTEKVINPAVLAVKPLAKISEPELAALTTLLIEIPDKPLAEVVEPLTALRKNLTREAYRILDSETRQAVEQWRKTAASDSLLIKEEYYQEPEPAGKPAEAAAVTTREKTTLPFFFFTRQTPGLRKIPAMFADYGIALTSTHEQALDDSLSADPESAARLISALSRRHDAALAAYLETLSFLPPEEIAGAGIPLRPVYTPEGAKADKTAVERYIDPAEIVDLETDCRLYLNELDEKGWETVEKEEEEKVATGRMSKTLKERRRVYFYNRYLLERYQKTFQPVQAPVKLRRHPRLGWVRTNRQGAPFAYSGWRRPKSFFYPLIRRTVNYRAGGRARLPRHPFLFFLRLSGQPQYFIHQPRYFQSLRNLFRFNRWFPFSQRFFRREQRFFRLSIPSLPRFSFISRIMPQGLRSFFSGGIFSGMRTGIGKLLAWTAKKLGWTGIKAGVNALLAAIGVASTAGISTILQGLGWLGSKFINNILRPVFQALNMGDFNLISAKSLVFILLAVFISVFGVHFLSFSEISTAFTEGLTEEGQGEYDNPVEPVPPGMSAALDQIFRETSAWAGEIGGNPNHLPAGVIAAIARIEGEYLFGKTGDYIAQYSQPGAKDPFGYDGSDPRHQQMGCRVSSCGDTGPMQFLTGLAIRSCPNYNSALGLNVWNNHQGAVSQKLGRTAGVCNIKDSIFGAAHKLATANCGSGEPNKERVYCMAERYHGNCTNRYSWLNNKTYCEFVWDFYRGYDTSILADQIFQKFNITMKGYDRTRLQWAWEILNEVSNTRFINFVRGTTITARAGDISAQIDCLNTEVVQHNNEDWFKIILIHEWGHLIRNCFPHEDNRWEDHMRAYTTEGALTQYSALSCYTGKNFESEDYADMVAYYLNPARDEGARNYNGQHCHDAAPNPYKNGAHPLHFGVAKSILGVYP